MLCLSTGSAEYALPMILLSKTTVSLSKSLWLARRRFAAECRSGHRVSVRARPGMDHAVGRGCRTAIDNRLRQSPVLTVHLPGPAPGNSHCGGMVFAECWGQKQGKSMSRTEQEDNKQALPLIALPAMDVGEGFDLLAGVRVLDLTGSIAGPYGTMLLADMGADIIKVERPGLGDDTRSWGPPFLAGEALWFLSVNRNKRSISLDYTTPEGLAILKKLVAICDVVVVNHLPKVASKLGVDVASLQALKSDLIYVSITGFGLEGERSDWACYDLIAEGYSGVMDLTGELTGGPQKVGAPAADMLAGSDAAYATVAALFAKARTGRGRVVDIALVDSMTRFLACRIVPYFGSGEVPRRSGGKDSVIAIYQAFETADRPMTLALGNDNIWQRFWQAVGQPEVGMQPQYATNTDRRTHRQELVQRIEEILKQRTRSQWLDIFKLARIPAGPINRVDEVAADPVLQRRGLFYKLCADGREVPQVGTGIIVDGKANQPRHQPPVLGEHTVDILQTLLGCGEAEIASLRNAKAI
jgi:crotonobetainyl-CoA:carnitine CoA-transferase CaiB-like acyl-CoA transferase